MTFVTLEVDTVFTPAKLALILAAVIALIISTLSAVAELTRISFASALICYKLPNIDVGSSGTMIIDDTLGLSVECK